MKVFKFFGETSRSVLEQVRNELGPDAMIVSSRPTPNGLEITAMPADALAAIEAPPPPPRAAAVPARAAAAAEPRRWEPPVAAGPAPAGSALGAGLGAQAARTAADPASDDVLSRR